MEGWTLRLVIGGRTLIVDTHAPRSETQLSIDSLATAMMGTKRSILGKSPRNESKAV